MMSDEMPSINGMLNKLWLTDVEDDHFGICYL